MMSEFFTHSVNKMDIVKNSKASYWQTLKSLRSSKWFCLLPKIIEQVALIHGIRWCLSKRLVRVFGKWLKPLARWAVWFARWSHWKFRISASSFPLKLMDLKSAEIQEIWFGWFMDYSQIYVFITTSMWYFLWNSRNLSGILLTSLKILGDVLFY